MAVTSGHLHASLWVLVKIFQGLTGLEVVAVAKGMAGLFLVWSSHNTAYQPGRVVVGVLVLVVTGVVRSAYGDSSRWL